MSRNVVIVGAGMGGLAAALHLARSGYHVHVIEARAEAGGLASGFQQDRFRFDAGPYVLLDRLGLEWAFRSLGLDLAEHVTLRLIEEVYQVEFPEAAPLRFCVRSTFLMFPSTTGFVVDQTDFIGQSRPVCGQTRSPSR